MSTQWLGAALMSIYLFCLCISFGFWYMGHELENAGLVSAANNPILARSQNITALNERFNATAQTYEGGAGFNPTFIFGDFGKGVSEFMAQVAGGVSTGFNIATGGYLTTQMKLLGFPLSFQQGAQAVIVGFGVSGALIYYISGRS